MLTFYRFSPISNSSFDFCSTEESDYNDCDYKRQDEKKSFFWLYAGVFIYYAIMSIVFGFVLHGATLEGALEVPENQCIIDKLNEISIGVEANVEKDSIDPCPTSITIAEIFLAI